jgi:hypothetical protein
MKESGKERQREGGTVGGRKSGKRNERQETNEGTKGERDETWEGGKIEVKFPICGKKGESINSFATLLTGGLFFDREHFSDFGPAHFFVPSFPPCYFLLGFSAFFTFLETWHQKSFLPPSRFLTFLSIRRKELCILPLSYTLLYLCFSLLPYLFFYLTLLFLTFLSFLFLLSFLWHSFPQNFQLSLLCILLPFYLHILIYVNVLFLLSFSIIINFTREVLNAPRLCEPPLSPHFPFLPLFLII